LLAPGGFRSRGRKQPRFVPDIYPKRLVDEAWTAYASGKHGLAVQLCKRAVDSKIIQAAAAFNIQGEPEECLFNLRVMPHIIHDYRALHWARGSEDDALRSITTASLLIGDLQDVEKERYHGLGNRLVAFLLDTIVILSVTAVISIPLIRRLFSSFAEGTVMDATLIVALTAIMGIYWAVEIAYFTLLEWKMGRTLGKRFMNMRVACEDGKICGFMPVFTRNVLRIIDELAMLSMVFLIPYILLFERSEKRQRLGDRLAGTVVLKDGVR